MCITAFPVLARMLVETGLYKRPVGSAALRAAVDDAIAWILLASVVGLTRNGSASAAIPVFILAAIFVAFMFLIGTRLLNLLARRYDAIGHLTVDMVAIGNPLNAPALVDAAIRLTGGKRPAELLLVRLIPTPRAPEFRTGLLEAESQVEAAVQSMRPLVEQAALSGVIPRPISFLSDDVSPDLARVAHDQHCDTMLLGWHRASLPKHVIQALVHRVFTLAACDVAIFVDPVGTGIKPEAERPVVIVLESSEQDDAAIRLGLRLAEDMQASVRLTGYVGENDDRAATVRSEELAERADALRQQSGLWVVPVFVSGDTLHDAGRETAEGAVTVVPVGDDWQTQEDFGHPAAELAELTACPMFVVRAAGTVGGTTDGKPKRRIGRPTRETVPAGR